MFEGSNPSLSFIILKNYKGMPKNIVFISQTHSIPVLWKQVSLNVAVFFIFTYCLVLSTVPGTNISKVSIRPLRPSVEAFFSFNTEAWSDVSTDLKYFSFSFGLFSVRKHYYPHFDRPSTYVLINNGQTPYVFLSNRQEESLLTQIGFELFSYLANESRFLPWSQGYQLPAAADYIGTRHVSPSYGKRHYYSGEVIMLPEALVYEQNIQGHSYPIVVIANHLINMGNLLPTPVHELTDKNSIFFDPRVRAMFGKEGIEVRVEQLDAYLIKSVSDLIRLYTNEESFCFFESSTVMQRELNSQALSLTFELLSRVGFWSSKDVTHLQNRLLEVGIDIKPRAVPKLDVNLDSEIAFIERSLADFLPKLMVNLSPKQVQALLVYKNPSRVTHAIAERICTVVWFSWRGCLLDLKSSLFFFALITNS